MGLNYASLLLLKKTELIRASASYGLDDRQNRATKCLMFGRAKVSLSSNQAKQAAEQLELPLENLTGWSERLLMDLGCTEVDSLDFSSFEGAKIIWNLNSLLNTTQTYEAFQGKYDLILDYGTAEHVFTPSASLANAIYLLRDGGRINYMLPVCGWCDHGFYQFSPTYFYSLAYHSALELEHLYFWVYRLESTRLDLWNGLNPKFMEHIHGSFDGSFAANCLEHLNIPICAWAVIKKNRPIQPEEIMCNTQQEIYRKIWNSQDVAIENWPNKLKVLTTTRLPKFMQVFLLRNYVKRLRSTVRDIQVI